MSQQSANSCEIFGIAGVIVQLVLGGLSFSVLIIKRYHEFPKRPWKIWALDTSKQAVSQLIAHFFNVAISLMLSKKLSNDACIWYFTTNVIDNTLGVFICCGTLRLVEKIIIQGRWDQFKSGNYYDIVEYEDNAGSVYTSERGKSISTQVASQYIKPLEISAKKRIIIINYFSWFVQLLIWNLIVSVSKTLIFFLELGLNSPLNAASEFLLGWVQPYPTLQLVIVIILIPVIMNGFAFWIQDNFLKKNEDKNKNSQMIFKQPLL